MINSANIHNYRIGESVQFLKYVLDLVERHDNKPQGIPEKTNNLRAVHTDYEAAYKNELRNKLTKQVEQLDNRRDYAELCLKNVAEGFMYHHRPEIKEAATKIVDTIAKYGDNIARLNYQEETPTLRRLVSEITSTPELMDAVNKLQLQETLQEIETANNEFENIYILRLQQNAAVTSKSAMELKKDAIAAYYDLVKIIEAHILILGIEPFKTLVAELNQLIESYNKIVDDRSSSGETEENEGEDVIE